MFSGRLSRRAMARPEHVFPQYFGRRPGPGERKRPVPHTAQANVVASMWSDLSSRFDPAPGCSQHRRGTLYCTRLPLAALWRRQRTAIPSSAVPPLLSGTTWSPVRSVSRQPGTEHHGCTAIAALAAVFHCRPYAALRPVRPRRAEIRASKAAWCSGQRDPARVTAPQSRHGRACTRGTQRVGG